MDTETSISTPEVDQLVDIAATLTVGELNPLSVLTKRARDKDQRSSWENGSPNKTHVIGMMPRGW